MTPAQRESELLRLAEAIARRSVALGYQLEEDARQEAIVALLEVETRVDLAKGTLATYGYRAAGRSVADYCRRLVRPVSTPLRPNQRFTSVINASTHRAVLDERLETEGDTPEEAAAQEERDQQIRGRLVRVLRQVAPDQVPALLDVLLCEQSPRQVAAREGLDEGLLRRWLREATRALAADPGLQGLFQETQEAPRRRVEVLPAPDPLPCLPSAPSWVCGAL